MSEALQNAESNKKTDLFIHNVNKCLYVFIVS